MANKDGPKQPSRPTVKRLFAVSGNHCAFPKCDSSLIDIDSGSVIGEICHIKGENPKASRYDENQTNKERHAFENLILLCNIHHKIVDDDERSYSVDRLIQIKKEHESDRKNSTHSDKATTDKFVNIAIEKCTIYGGFVTSSKQNGGQTAHTINNYNYRESNGDKPVQIECKIGNATSLELIAKMGCPGLETRVICRSARQAKIHSVHLLIDGVDVVEGFEQGFGASFGYVPLPGSTQIFDVHLIPISKPNSPNGFVLDRDDIALFFYPLPLPATTLALQAKTENLTIVARLFDDTEIEILKGEPIKEKIETLFGIYRNRPGSLRCTITCSIRVKSINPPGPEMADLVGKVNSNYVPIAKRTQASNKEGSK